jgi:hypothetical protein
MQQTTSDEIRVSYFWKGTTICDARSLPGQESVCDAYRRGALEMVLAGRRAGYTTQELIGQCSEYVDALEHRMRTHCVSNGVAIGAAISREQTAHNVGILNAAPCQFTNEERARWCIYIEALLMMRAIENDNNYGRSVMRIADGVVYLQ